MSDESGVQGFSALQVERDGLAVMNGVWRQLTDAAVAANGVVPLEELSAMSAGVLDRAEARREVGSVLQGFELRFRERIVVRDVRTAVSFDDVEIDEQSGHRLGAHAGTAVGMQGQSARIDVLLLNRIGDELLGQFRRFARSDHPADNVAAEDVEDDVEMEVTPLDWPLYFRDIPTPHFVGPDRQQFRFGIGRVVHSGC